MRRSSPAGCLFSLEAPPTERRRRAARGAPGADAAPLPAIPPILETRRAQFRPLACSTVLNENRNPTLPFRWTLNPYRGCEFGCTYCYAPYTHRYLGQTDAASFASRIYVKFQAPQVLAETLKPGMLKGRPLAMGTATDPYQPAEKRFRMTRRLLEVLARCPDLELSVTTKSPLIARDIDLLRRIARSGPLTVHVSLTTLNPGVARILEPHAPTPRRRLETIGVLRSAGIEVGLFVMPILPGITDAPRELRALLHAAKESGASFAAAQMVRLFGPSWDLFDPVLRAHFPHLIGRYGALHARGGLLEDDVARPIRECFRAIRSELALDPPARTTPPALTSEDRNPLPDRTQVDGVRSEWLFSVEVGTPGVFRA